MKTVIRTDVDGKDLGEVEIIEAHTGEGTLHKAFSAFVFSPDFQQLLIQQRADAKMLFARYWANTCCSHPTATEELTVTAERRLQEECGFTCELTPTDSFVYKAKDPTGSGIEHERDTVLVGNTPKDTVLTPDPNEIAELKWMEIQALLNDIQDEPQKYAPWFKPALDIALSHIVND